jgi:hypothetical protein
MNKIKWKGKIFDTYYSYGGDCYIQDREFRLRVLERNGGVLGLYIPEWCDEDTCPDLKLIGYAEYAKEVNER